MCIRDRGKRRRAPGAPHRAASGARRAGARPPASHWQAWTCAPWRAGARAAAPGGAARRAWVDSSSSDPWPTRRRSGAQTRGPCRCQPDCCPFARATHHCVTQPGGRRGVGCADMVCVSGGCDGFALSARRPSSHVLLAPDAGCTPPFVRRRCGDAATRRGASARHGDVRSRLGAGARRGRRVVDSVPGQHLAGCVGPMACAAAAGAWGARRAFC